MQVPDYTIDKKQTVAGQMDDLLKSDSPYMQQAATAGKQLASSRGLLNSSMAAGAAQGSSIERALPIVAADANTYNAFAGQKYGTQLQGAINNQIQGFTQDNMNLGNTLQKGLNSQQQGFQQDNMRLGDTIQRGQMGLANDIQQTQMRLQNALNQGDMRLANTLQQQLNSQQQQFTQENMATEQANRVGLLGIEQGFQQENMVLGNQLDQGNMNLANSLGQSDMRLNQQLSEMQAQADYARSMGQMDKAAEIDRNMASLQQGFQQSNMQLGDTLQRGQNEQQFNFNQQSLGQSTTANTQGKYLDALDQITNNAMVSINEIEVAEGITQAEKDAMIANTIRRRDADLAWTRNVYSNMPTWDFSWLDIGSGSMPEAPGVA